MNIYSIYKITNLINSKCYIGFTTHSEDRWYNHKAYANYDRKNTHLYNAMKHYGVDNFSFEVIYESTDEPHTHNVMENYFINEYDSFNKGYNMTLGGEGCVGRIESEHTRLKKSLAKLGKKRPPLTEEQKSKISASKKGKPWTQARLDIGYKRKEPKDSFPAILDDKV